MSTCRTCKFYRLGSGLGECRRRPPALVVVAEASAGSRDRQRVETRWPRVGEGEWCGEHQPQPRTEPA